MGQQVAETSNSGEGGNWFTDALDITGGAASAVDKEGEKAFGPGWLDRVTNNLGAKGTFEYTPEQLNSVIADLEDLVEDFKGDRVRIANIIRLIEAPSEDYASQAYADHYREAMEDLLAKNQQMRDVANKMLERHVAAKKQMDTTEGANEDTFRDQNRSMG